MNAIIEKLLEIGGLPVALLLLGYLAGRYFKPWIHKNQERLNRFQEIALIADRITDEMVLLFPNVPWDNWLDKAVDKLIKACDLTDLDDVEKARREVSSQIVKKMSHNGNYLKALEFQNEIKKMVEERQNANLKKSVDEFSDKFKK